MAKVVVLDAGHGGSDPGAVGFVVEKDVVLDIAHATRKHLLTYENVIVLLTRANDRYVSLEERCEFANASKAEVFVSIHANAGGGEGLETYRFPGSVKGENLQEAIHNSLMAWLSEYDVGASMELVEPPAEVHDRGMKAARFYVLKYTKMPAVLVEALFVDDERDAALLSDPEFRRQFGCRIADGIATYLGLEVRWDPGQEIQRLLERGFISTPREAEAVVKWWEMAALFNRVLDEHEALQQQFERFLKRLKEILP